MKATLLSTAAVLVLATCALVSYAAVVVSADVSDDVNDSPDSPVSDKVGSAGDISSMDGVEEARPGRRHRRKLPTARNTPLPSADYISGQLAIEELAAAHGIPEFTAHMLGMHRETAVHSLNTATTQRLTRTDPVALDMLEAARDLAESVKRHAEILQLELSMAVQAIQHIVDAIEHKHDYTVIYNDIAAFFGIFAYIGSLEGMGMALAKFVFKEIAFAVMPKSNALEVKELAAERDVILRINDIVDTFYSHCARLFREGRKSQLDELARLFDDGKMDVSTADFQLSFRRKLVQYLLRGRYTASRCVTKACVGHPILVPGSTSGHYATYKSDLKTRQIKYLDEIGVDWYAVYTGKDGWEPKNKEEDTYKCHGYLPGFKSKGHGVHCDGHWHDLLPLVRQVVYDGEIVREKTLTRG